MPLHLLSSCFLSDEDFNEPKKTNGDQSCCSQANTQTLSHNPLPSPSKSLDPSPQNCLSPRPKPFYHSCFPPFLSLRLKTHTSTSSFPLFLPTALLSFRPPPNLMIVHSSSSCFSLLFLFHPSLPNPSFRRRPQPIPPSLLPSLPPFFSLGPPPSLPESSSLLPTKSLPLPRAQAPRFPKPGPEASSCRRPSYSRVSVRGRRRREGGREGE